MVSARGLAPPATPPATPEGNWADQGKSSGRGKVWVDPPSFFAPSGVAYDGQGSLPRLCCPTACNSISRLPSFPRFSKVGCWSGSQPWSAKTPNQSSRPAEKSTPSITIQRTPRRGFCRSATDRWAWIHGMASFLRQPTPPQPSKSVIPRQARRFFFSARGRDEWDSRYGESFMESAKNGFGLIEAFCFPSPLLIPLTRGCSDLRKKKKKNSGAPHPRFHPPVVVGGQDWDLTLEVQSRLTDALLPTLTWFGGGRHVEQSPALTAGGAMHTLWTIPTGCVLTEYYSFWFLGFFAPPRERLIEIQIQWGWGWQTPPPSAVRHQHQQNE